MVPDSPASGRHNRRRLARRVTCAQLCPPQVLDHNAAFHWETPGGKKSLEWWASWLKERWQDHPYLSRVGGTRRPGTGEMPSQLRAVASRPNTLTSPDTSQGLVSPAPSG